MGGFSLGIAAAPVLAPTRAPLALPCRGSQAAAGRAYPHVFARWLSRRVAALTLPVLMTYGLMLLGWG